MSDHEIELPLMWLSMMVSLQAFQSSLEVSGILLFVVVVFSPPLMCHDCFSVRSPK